MSLKDDLQNLANSIARKATLSDTDLQQSVDALKALTQYYAVLQKGRKADDDDSSEGTFADFAAQIDESKGASNGAVRSRRRAAGTDGH